MLSAEDFGNLICALIRDKEGNLATRYVEGRAAAFLGGSTRSKTHVYNPPRGFGYRRFDINAGRRSFELKFRGDRVSRWEVEKDLWFRRRSDRAGRSRVNLWYLFIDGSYREQPTIEDFRRLGNAIPYLHWTWEQFLRLTQTLQQG